MAKVKPATQATAIAALEAERNEQMTLAAGALAGERRNSIARMAMIAMFAVVMEIEPRITGSGRPFDLLRFAVGSFYTLFSLGTLIAVHRTTASPRSSKVR